MIKAARDMGVSLQLTNITRDIVSDSENLGRCYVATEFFKEADMDPEEVLKDLTERRQPWNLGETKLRQLSLQILDYADTYKKEGLKGIGLLPEGARRPIMVATEIYGYIGTVIRRNSKYVRRAHASTFTKLRVLFKCMYLPMQTTKACS